jgi:hypothetical protein
MARWRVFRTAWQLARRTPLHAALAVLATLATAAVIVVPLAVVRYPPMVDLPAHAAQSATFRHYLDASWHFQEQFELRPFEVPYLSFYAVGALAMLVLPPPAAMKVAVAVMLALLPLGLALLLRGMKKSPLLAVCALPLLWNPLAHWGFLNYLGALGLQAASVGLTLLLLERPARARQAALCLALCAVFFSHVFRFPFAVATVVGTTLLMAPVTRRVWPVVPALTPPLLLFGAWWVMRPPSLQTMPELAFYPDRGGKVVESLVGAFQGSGERRALAFAAAMLALVAALAVVARSASRAPPPPRREQRWRRATTLVALGCAATSLALFFALPMQVGTWWYIYPREAVATAFLALALLPDLPRAIWVRGAVLAGAVVAAMPLTALVTRSYASFDEETHGFASLVQQLPQAPRLLYLVFDHSGTNRSISPFTHLPAWVQAERGGWISHHFESFGATPVRYRPRAGREDIIPPPTPPTWEGRPDLFRVEVQGRFFDWFLVRSEWRRDDVFAADPAIELVARADRWWLYRRQAERAPPAHAAR